MSVVGIRILHLVQGWGYWGCFARESDLNAAVPGRAVLWYTNKVKTYGGGYTIIQESKANWQQVPN